MAAPPPPPPRTTARRSSGAVRRPGKQLMAYDRALGHRIVAGSDEAGRGCLAGPLVAAAVALDYDRLVGPDAAPFGGLDDSKRLTPSQREHLYGAVLAAATSWSVVAVSAATIDRRGLHVCNLDAMRRALGALRAPLTLALVDGFALDDMPFESRRIVKGDRTSAAIAAASILAKVTRDRLMQRLDAQLDGRWAFAEHMGYATELHHERIRRHGVTIWHRRSFASGAYDGADWSCAVGLDGGVPGSGAA